MCGCDGVPEVCEHVVLVWDIADGDARILNSFFEIDVVAWQFNTALEANGSCAVVLSCIDGQVRGVTTTMAASRFVFHLSTYIEVATLLACQLHVR